MKQRLFLSYPTVHFPGMDLPETIRTADDARRNLAELSAARKRALQGAKLVNNLSLSEVKKGKLKMWGGRSASHEVIAASYAGMVHIASGRHVTTDVLVASHTSSLSTGYSLEFSGLSDGWHLVDVFSIPYALESSIAHALAYHTQSDGCRSAICEGEFSGFHLLESCLSILEENSDASVLLCCTEHFGAEYERICQLLVMDGASPTLFPDFYTDATVVFSAGSSLTGAVFEVLSVGFSIRDASSIMEHLRIADPGSKRSLFYALSDNYCEEFRGLHLDTAIRNVRAEYGFTASAELFIAMVDFMSEENVSEASFVWRTRVGRSCYLQLRKVH